MRPLDLTGRRFGRLTALALATTGSGGRSWQCVCDCGGEKIVRTEYLRSGETKSCGCLLSSAPREQFTTHGMSKHRRGEGYVSWTGMKDRCLNPNNREYARYGARGIRVCDRWLRFENFIADMGMRPSPHHSLDRIDPNGDYEPGNCRWATALTQGRNTRRALKLVVNGKSVPAMDVLEDVLRKATIEGVSALDFFSLQNVGVGLRRMDGTVEVRHERSR
ncbi:hypothetical protein [Hansschlegelia sp.]|uniref:hypothetical protein n=1 Tax=Hansschlegelia sp. TaxID=2041892 RepID=UPI002C3E0030|nr:hypothetical protein [Hansschlegelia sp.]HVI27483.1 hypothetical protein [Hansschlegelia sp.]